MRFKLSLRPLQAVQKLIFNYHYPFASWIYERINSADAQYGDFLHQKGYQASTHSKSFKHFTFSKFQIAEFVEPIKKGDRYMLIGSKPIEVIISFYVEQSAQNFVAGLFKQQELSIYDRTYSAMFIIERIETLPAVELQDKMQLQVLSPLVIAEKDATGKDEYLQPQDPRFAKYFAINLVSKYQSILSSSLEIDAQTAQQLVRIRIIDKSKMRHKVIQIKHGQTQIKGYFGFTLEIEAPKAIIAVGFYGGFGKYCSVAGMGYTEPV